MATGGAIIETTERPLLKFLSDAALDGIEQSAYRLLNEVGVSLQHHGAVEMLHGLGCRIERGRAHIRRDVVQWALDNVTPDRELLNPDGGLAFTLGDGRVRFHNGGGRPRTLDLDTGRERPATLKDVADAARLLDALPHVDQLTPPVWAARRAPRAHVRRVDSRHAAEYKEAGVGGSH